MDDALVRLLSNFLIALGVTVGGALSGAAASMLLGGHPLDRIRFLSDEMRLWGILVAMSGSFEPLRNLEQGLFGWQSQNWSNWVQLLRQAVFQVLLILVAMVGAHIGYLLLSHLAGRK